MEGEEQGSVGLGGISPQDRGGRWGGVDPAVATPSIFTLSRPPTVTKGALSCGDEGGGGGPVGSTGPDAEISRK